MTDVFIRVFSSSELRLGFAIATVARWKMQKDAKITVLQWAEGINYNFGCDTQRLLNRYEAPYATCSLSTAEAFANSDPYIICNDDILIYGHDFVSKGLEIMERNPEYGCISGVVTNSDQFSGKDEVTEAHAVGGLVFLRKNLVTEFKPLEDCFWDGYRHAQVAAKGFKSGYAGALPYLHIGAHFSVANPAFFVGA